MEPESRRAVVTRFLKFAVVGCSGLVVNVVVFETFIALLTNVDIETRIVIANAIGVLVSIFTNFMLNDKWTWADRAKVSFSRRLIRYYAAASIAAAIQMFVTWASFKLVWSDAPTVVLDHDVGPTVSLLTGIGCGMVVNFLASHLWAFKEQS